MQLAKFALCPIALVAASPATLDAASQPIASYAQSGSVRIAFEVVGDGASGRPHDVAAYRHHQLAADIVAVLDQLSIEAADFLGYSRGGAIAIVTAVSHPDRVHRLILGGAHPYAENLSAFRDAVAPGLHSWINIIEANAGPLPDAARASFLANDIHALRAAVAEDRPDLSAELAAHSIPTLLYAGSRDPRASVASRFAEETGATLLPDHADATRPVRGLRFLNNVAGLPRCARSGALNSSEARTNRSQRLQVPGRRTPRNG